MWPGISTALAKGVGVGTVELLMFSLCYTEERGRRCVVGGWGVGGWALWGGVRGLLDDT